MDSDFDEFIGSVEDKIGRAADIVLVVHQPIHNTKTDQLYSGSHVGNKSYRKFIEILKEDPSCGLWSYP